MNKYGIPASITLAQGILESGNGNSDLAKYANNHFGIKCTTDWKGKAYYKDDDQKDDCFRVYADARQSYRDHSDFLKRKRYAFLFELDKNDYTNWAKGLKTAGYATNPKYPELLIGIIEKYNLHQYDQPETETDKLKREDRVLDQINTGMPKETKKYTPVAVAPKDPPKAINTEGTAQPAIVRMADGNGLYTVQKGDGLYSIAKRFGLTVDELKKINHLEGDNINVGQKLQTKNILNTFQHEEVQAQRQEMVIDSLGAGHNSKPAYNEYIVQKGDSLFGIAKTFSLTVDELKQLNHLTDNNIKVGQKLVVTK